MWQLQDYTTIPVLLRMPLKPLLAIKASTLIILATARNTATVRHTTFTCAPPVAPCTLKTWHQLLAGAKTAQNGATAPNPDLERLQMLPKAVPSTFQRVQMVAPSSTVVMLAAQIAVSNS